MGKRELVLDAFDGKAVERVPVGFWFHFVPDGLFEETPEHIQKNIEGHQAFFDGFHPDFLKLMSDGYFTYPNPAIAEVRGAADLKKIKAVNPEEWIAKQVALVKELTGRFGKQVASFYNIFSPATYLKWEEIELSEENALAVLVPAGIGHGFLAMEDNTMQFFAIDKSGTDGHSKQLNYTEKKISLKLPIPVTDISDYDLNAPFLD